MKHTHFNDEIEVHKGNDWLGMFFAVLAALVVATIIVDVATGYQLHEIIGNLIANAPSGA